ncbi:MAG: N-acetylmuramoyl-L-alanine amidase [Candidatus Aminicenantes bacterium]|nr:N-acetylmuramoyl-L-alanine amidase [Candidatus Aminicenantes bacterium]
MTKFMKYKSLLLVLSLLVSFPVFSLTVNIRSFDHEGFTRLVFEGDSGFEYKIESSKKGLEIRLNKKLTIKSSITTFHDSRLIDKIIHKVERKKSSFTVKMKSPYTIDRHFVLERPFRLVFDLVKSPGEERIQQSTGMKKYGNVQQEDQDFNYERPKKRTLIERICIDPGHGGSNFGAIGKSNLMEKDITLKVSKKLKRLIESRLGLRVIMTRTGDAEVSLDSRAALANNQKANMFISIHVNGSFRKAANGPETFFVSLKATDQEAFRLAEKENKSFEEIDKMAEDDELKLILWNMAQTEYIKDSSKLAEFIQNELNILLHTTNRGVKQAPFKVLMQAAMPAVLVEIAFLSNPAEEKKLKKDSFLEEVALAIYTGINKYIYYQNSRYY